MLFGVEFFNSHSVLLTELLNAVLAEHAFGVFVDAELRQASIPKRFSAVAVILLVDVAFINEFESFRRTHIL